jgi:peroxin-19
MTQLIEYMQEIQEYGQPPSDIIQEIAPGIELDSDGIPKMNGDTGMPMPYGNEECRIM